MHLKKQICKSEESLIVTKHSTNRFEDQDITMAPQISQTDAYVLGVGMTPFIKPRKQRMYPELGFEAGVKAMLDAQINYDDVETAVACYCYVRARIL